MGEFGINMLDNVCQKKLKTFLVVLIVAILLGIYYQFQSYYRVHTTNPVKNIKVEVTKPVYDTSTSIQWHGSYDRELYCKLVNFHIVLKHDSGAVNYLLDKNNLTSRINNDVKPGKNIPIDLALRTPHNIALGDYTSDFLGVYFCGKGIFRAERAIHIEIGKFEVIAGE